MPNRNYLWTRLFVEELHRNGLQAVCIAPGSRSTPLAIAFFEHPAIQSFIHLDERSAAYAALGMAQTWEMPVAVICTSGTAAANFFPAVVEAYQNQIPLLVLTTDRPHEVRYSGANQTIDQIKIYGDYALWSVDAPLPEENPSALTVRSMRTLASRAYHTANGLVKGAVHINFPFRSPLEPVPVATDHTEAFDGLNVPGPIVDMAHGQLHLHDDDLDYLVGVIQNNPNGIIIAGPRTPLHLQHDLIRLAQKSGYPILAEPLSNVRFGGDADAPIFGAYENFALPPNPDVIIQFGKVPTSKVLNTWLDGINLAHRIMFGDVWADDTHRLTEFYQTDPVLACRDISTRLTPRLNSAWLADFRSKESAIWERIEANLGDFDGAVVHDVIELMPDYSTLFVGNSLPVRHVEEFGRPSGKHIKVLGNRGASGIDGVVSSAIGAAIASKAPTVLLIGDISFYHDMNGLLALMQTRYPQNLKIVLLNNDGGGIFRRLPIAQFEPPFEELFITRHGLDFAHAANLYGLPYTCIENANRAAFREAFLHSWQHDQPCIIEFQSDSRQDMERRQALKKLLKGN
ncbi:MAG: 2-succinyl-5-enolpyruvyl-6-hydroxy-3-cyclohexene-1-carboxylic-acid synthase [Anaerolineae bacterium]|nr:2-succinyl-5-enolpyruvyl-6-hydroxy-3-cyclohexene-1-carboxylic-acid synthase [Anaerolineae bacterium]